MAQKQYTTYQEDILSFELRDALLGLLQPGRYIGFNNMSEYQAQVGNNIYIRISHSNGVNKYDKASPPVLEAQRGVAISTQGTIIAEDGNVDLTLVINPSGNVRWHIIYMEHEYTEVAGANPATYGLITGVDGGGKPALTSTTNRIIIGYIKEDLLPSAFANLTWYPINTENNFGDHKLSQRLWGDGSEDFLDENIGANLGTVPSSDGIIGNRNYTTGNYITDYESITSALDDLDIQAKAEEVARVGIGNRALDSGSWGVLTDVLTGNSSGSAHGLLPKLSGDNTTFFNGNGSWEVPLTGFTFIGSTANYHYNSNAFGGTITLGTLQDLSLSAQIPTFTTQVVLTIEMQCLYGTANASGRYGGVLFSAGGTGVDQVGIVGPYPLAQTAVNGNPAYLYVKHNIICAVNGSRQIRLTYGNYAGSTTDWLLDLRIKVVAYS